MQTIQWYHGALSLNIGCRYQQQAVYNGDCINLCLPFNSTYSLPLV